MLTALDSDVIVGKDILELLSSSMYVEPLTIFREYVQNSADAIDEAVDKGILEASAGRIEIETDPTERRILIRDNGIGIKKHKFSQRMTTFGASHKRGTTARGFRGVGRLAGLGYCQELLFRSRSHGEKEISEIAWDCRRMKALLSDASFSGELNDIVQKVVTLRNYEDSNQPDHFFEVDILKPLRFPGDTLLNEVAIGAYLSQVAPVPFARDYRFSDVTYDTLSKHLKLGEFQIYIGKSKEQIYRPYKNFISYSNEQKGGIDTPEFFEIDSIDGSPAAIGWILHHDYRGAIPNSSGVKGLRARVGNIQIGTHKIFSTIFPESRFNSWTVGEVHILDQKIVPNGRRDNFEQNSHLSNLTNRLMPITHNVARHCRNSSAIRNRIKIFELGSQKIDERLKVLQQGAIPRNTAATLRREVGALLLEIRKAADFDLINEGIKADLLSSFQKLEKRTSGLSKRNGGSHNALDHLSKRDRQMFEKVIGLIYECSANHVTAKSLVDRILARMSHA
jgi:molecular chaperone HtpG